MTNPYSSPPVTQHGQSSNECLIDLPNDFVTRLFWAIVAFSFAVGLFPLCIFLFYVTGDTDGSWAGIGVIAFAAGFIAIASALNVRQRIRVFEDRIEFVHWIKKYSMRDSISEVRVMKNGVSVRHIDGRKLGHLQVLSHAERKKLIDLIKSNLKVPVSDGSQRLP